MLMTMMLLLMMIMMTMLMIDVYEDEFDYDKSNLLTAILPTIVNQVKVNQ